MKKNTTPRRTLIRYMLAIKENVDIGMKPKTVADEIVIPYKKLLPLIANRLMTYLAL